MKRYEDSIVSYRCETCTCTIYNADREFTKCDNCGSKLTKINKPVKEYNK
jgi:rRNA maturation endonuclease Nob1